MTSNSSSKLKRKSIGDAESDASASTPSTQKGTSTLTSPTKKSKDIIKDEKLLGFFWELASLEASDRTEAAHSLALYLFQQQKEWKSSEGESIECPQITYSLKRLIKGLTSPREGARQGFSLALSQVLRLFEFTNLKEVYDSLLESTKVSAAMKGQEEREMIFGRIFGIIAIIRSQRISSSTDPDFIISLIKELLSLSEKKHYLGEICYEGINLLFDNISRETFANLIPQLKPLLQQKATPLTADFLSVLIRLKDRFEYSFEESVPALQASSIIDAKNLHTIIAPLKDSTYNHPRIHSIWTALLNELAKCNTQTINHFWNVVVDQNLFTSTHERQYLAFQLFINILPLLHDNNITSVFTKNFMRCLITNVTSPENYLHKSASLAMSSIMKVAQNNKSMCLPIALQLIGEYGHRNFDKITRTNTVATLLSNLDLNGVNSYLNYLIQSFIRPTLSAAQQEDNKDQQESLKAIENMRIWIVEQIYTLTKQKSIIKQEDWLSDALQFFCFYSLFHPNPKLHHKDIKFTEMEPSPAIGKRVTSVMKKRLISLISDLNSLPKLKGTTQPPEAAKEDDEENNEEHKMEERGVRHDGEHWIYFIAKYEELIASYEYQRNTSLSGDLIEARTTLLKRVHKIENKLKTKSTDSKKAKIRTAFELLYLAIYWHVHSLEEETQPADELLGIIEELNECYSKFFKKKRKSKSKSDKDQSADAEPAPIEVLIDILLSLLSNASSLLRDMVQRAFRNVSGELTADALNVLLECISRSDSGLTSVDENEDSEEVEMEVDSDDNKDNNNKPKHAAHDEQGGEEAEDESEEEELITDDEEMMKFDEKLSAMFKHLKAKKSQKKNMLRSVFQFKFKVLDLLEIAVRKLSTSPLIFQMILPLVRASMISLATAEANSFVNRITNLCCKKLFKVKEYPKDLNDSAVDDLNDMLDQLWRFTLKSSTTENTLSICSNAIHFIIRVLNGNQRDQTDNPKLITHFQTAITHFYTKRKLKTSFFTDFVSRHPWLGWKVVKTLLSGTKDARTDYLKEQQFIILHALIRSSFTSQSNIDNQLELIQSFIPELRASFLALFSNSAEFPAKRLKDIFSNLNGMFGVINRNIPQAEIQKLWPVNELKEELEKHVFSNPKYQTVSKLANNFLQALSSDKKQQQQQQQSKKENKELSESNEGSQQSKHSNGKSKKRKLDSNGTAASSTPLTSAADAEVETSNDKKKKRKKKTSQKEVLNE